MLKAYLTFALVFSHWKAISHILLCIYLETRNSEEEIGRWGQGEEKKKEKERREVDDEKQKRERTHIL